MFKDQMLGNLKGVMAIIFWSFSALFMSYASDAPVFLIMTVQYFSSAVLITLALIFMRKNLKNYWTRSLKGIALPFLGIGLYSLLFILAFKNAPPTEAALLNYLWPILLIFFSGLINNKKVATTSIIGSFIAFSGIVILKIDFNSLSHSFQLGHAFALTAAIVWAVYSIALQKSPTVKYAMPQTFLALTLFSACLHLCFEDIYSGSSTPLYFALALGFTSGSAYILWNHAMKQGNIDIVGILSYSTPLLSIVLLVNFGQDTPPPYILISLMMLFVGTIIVAKDKLQIFFKAMGVPYR